MAIAWIIKNMKGKTRRSVIVFASNSWDAGMIGKRVLKLTGLCHYSVDRAKNFDEYAMILNDHIPFTMEGDKIYREEGWSDFPEIRCKTCGLAQFESIRSSFVKNGECLRCRKDKEYNVSNNNL